MSARSERQIRLLSLAQACSELGARCRTIHCITGMPTRELQRLFFADASFARRGRAPDSPEWYYGANLLDRAEASIFVSVYARLRSSGFQAAESLVAAYRHYQSICQGPHRISFDRAFDLASHLDGIWVATDTALSLVPCVDCGSEHVAAPGSLASTSAHCPFCRLLSRYALDRRLQTCFPPKSTHDAGGRLQMLAALTRNLGDKTATVADTRHGPLPFFDDRSLAAVKSLAR